MTFKSNLIRPLRPTIVAAIVQRSLGLEVGEQERNEGRSRAHSAAETAVQRREAEPQTEARRKWRSQVAVRDERERNAANRPPPGGGWGRRVGVMRNERALVTAC